MIKGGTAYRFVLDTKGSVRLVVNSATGEVVQEIKYDEFGKVIEDTAPSFQPFGFAGGIYDKDTKLLRLGARDVDPSIGRWTTKDQLRFFGGLNLYQYAENDPINYQDPFGLSAYTDDEIACMSACDVGYKFCSFDIYKNPCEQNKCADELDECRDECTPKKKVKTPRKKGCRETYVCREPSSKAG